LVCVQPDPTGFLDPKDPSNPTKYLAPEAIRGSGGVLVNSEGKRFINELDLRSVVTAGIQQNCSPYKSADGYEGPPFAWCILSQEAQEIFGKPVLSFYKDKLGLFEDCDDIKAVAELIGCKTDTLVVTLQEYEEAAKFGTCKLTHKDVFPSPLGPNSKSLVVARVTPSIHYTMGGLNINPAGEVQERIESVVGSHRRIRGLFAAGEVTGGVHGENRLGGNSLLECVVFGRIAGERAATVKHPNSELFPTAKFDASESDDNFIPVTLREVRNTDEKFGLNTREIRFNMHGAFQHSVSAE
jgi:succinate dehydrogenase/fumarate reductase flavoprotein subunit